MEMWQDYMECTQTFGGKHSFCNMSLTGHGFRRMSLSSILWIRIFSTELAQNFV
jgi:hypothetical protein